MKIGPEVWRGLNWHDEAFWWSLSLLVNSRYPLISLGLLGLTFALSSASAAGGDLALPEVVDFNRDVRRLMSNTCFKCHGPDAKNNQSELRLDLREFATKPRVSKSGRTITAIVPGKPEQSEAWLRLTSADPLKVMPPPDALHQVTARDRAIIKRWIEQGAEYQPHWAYLPPKPVTPPTVQHSEWVKNLIDHFVVRKLEGAGLAPHPAADRVTLIRRVSLDLTGLPPTPAEVDLFLADDRPGAYARLVDRLLDSPHYGERMTVPWLDLVRFADSVGFHGDQRQNIFPYRDYVIAAFNDNKPYDQFVREQLAGDLLPHPTDEQIVATGFNRLNLMTREGGAQPLEYLAKSAADRVRAVSTTFLGSTVGCAECHDHKYDPFTTRDFYSLAAYFADVKQWGVYSDYKYTPNPDLVGYNNDFPFPPELDVKNDYLQRRAARLQQEQDERIDRVVETILAQADERGRVLDWARQNTAGWVENEGGWQALTPVEMIADHQTKPELMADGSVRLMTVKGAKKGGNMPPGVTLVVAPPPGGIAALRLEALPDPESNGTVARNDLGSFTVSPRVELWRVGESRPEPLDIAGGFPDRDSWTFENAYRVTSVEDRWRSAPRYAQDTQRVIYQLRRPVEIAAGDRLRVTLRTTDLARARLAASPLGLRRVASALDPELQQALRVAQEPASAATLSQAQWRLLAGEFFKGTGEPDAAAYGAALETLREIAACREGMAFTMVTEAVEPLVTRVLPRGNWQDESGAVVQPAPPQFLQGKGAAKSGRATRLDLAEWIVAPDNPLTARTLVNRLWNQFFGTGLSAVVDDLGLQGEYPSHPELLDWLAREFVESGWDVKAMVRLIVTSATYRQKSDFRRELREVDPTNRLLAMHPPRRLGAEFVRDNALFAAGLLNLDIGGPSAYPYQPEGYYVSLNFPKRDYEADSDERQYRRGLYTHWQRTFVHPMMANFDAPSREECTADRTVSNTPQQALTLLNDPSFVEAARALAQRAMKEPGTHAFEARLAHAFRLVLAREPTLEEAQGLKAFYATQLDHYTAEPADAAKLAGVGLYPTALDLDPPELAAWTQVARVLLNLNETLMRY